MPTKNTGLLIYLDEGRRRDLIKELVEGSYEPSEYVNDFETPLVRI